MPGFILTDAMVMAIAESIKAICEVQKLTLENMTPEQKAIQSALFTEMMKPGLMLLQGFNKWLEAQLAK